MDRRNMIWPTAGTGADLEKLLRAAAMAGKNSLNGSGDTIIVNYLDWVTNQIRMLQGVLSVDDLDRLLTSPRYWATLDNQIATSTTVAAVTEEIQHRVRLLEAAADAIAGEVAAWRPRDGKHSNLVVPDTNFWVNVDDSLTNFDWHDLLDKNPGPSNPSSGDEIRIIVPLIVIDELDGLSHRGDKRSKVHGINAYLHDALGDRPGSTRDVRENVGGKGEVTIQLLFDRLGHQRLPNNDDELVVQVAGLRDFLGHPERRVFFVTHDGGAAFRAANMGLMTRHLPTPKK